MYIYRGRGHTIIMSLLIFSCKTLRGVVALMGHIRKLGSFVTKALAFFV